MWRRQDYAGDVRFAELGYVLAMPFPWRGHHPSAGPADVRDAIRGTVLALEATEDRSGFRDGRG